MCEALTGLPLLDAKNALYNNGNKFLLAIEKRKAFAGPDASTIFSRNTAERVDKFVKKCFVRLVEIAVTKKMMLAELNGSKKWRTIEDNCPTAVCRPCEIDE